MKNFINTKLNKKIIFFSAVFFTVLLIINYSLPAQENKERPWKKFITNESLQLKIPDLKFFTLKNGIKVYFVNHKLLPRSFFSLYVYGTGFDEPDKQTGLNSLWGSMVTFSGSKEYPREKLAEYLEQRASSFSYSGGTERSSFSLSSLSHFFEDDLKLILSVIKNPQFLNEDFEILKQQTLKGIEKRKENPGSLAYIGSNLKFWENSIRGKITTKETINSISIEDLKKWQQEMYKAERFTLLLAGDYDEEKIKPILNDTLGSLVIDEKNKILDDALKVKPNNIKFTTFHIKKDLPQATVLLMTNGMKHSDEDYYPLKIYDFLLGGSSFNSELTQKIRVKKGWAYSVYSHYSAGLYFGDIRIFAQTANENLFDLLREVNTILLNPDSFAGKDKIMEAKKSLENKFVFLYETPESLLNTQLSLMWDGLSDDYLKNFIQKIEKVTNEDILKLAQKYYNPENFFLVIVGPENLFADKSKHKDIPWLKNIVSLEIPE
ncbi:MAG: insulinase family protein [Spirochaetia bacterium]|nr:insulinase family protein [Spirochaetia bacterium]